MDTSGRIYHLTEDEVKEQEKMWKEMVSSPYQDEMDEYTKLKPMKPLTTEEEQELKLQSLPRRKGWMKNKPCPCGSGEKFKKCCWAKAARFGRKPRREF